jgi:hypothetical protein
MNTEPSSSNFSGKNKHQTIQIVAVFIIVLVGASFLIFFNSPAKPVKVVQNLAGYATSTSVEVYSSKPKEFPDNIVLPGSVLVHSDIVRKSSGDYLVTETFFSKDDLLSAMTKEQSVLVSASWKILESQLSARSGFIHATNNSGAVMTVTFTISDAQNSLDINMQLSGRTSK